MPGRVMFVSSITRYGGGERWMCDAARGLAGARDTGRGRHAVVERVPRNAPAVFNLGSRQFHTMFHDGRVQLDPEAPGGVKMPEGRELERPLPSALAAQTILPILSHDEMAAAVVGVLRARLES